MNRKHMRGIYTVEFAFVGLLVFTLLFGVLEMGRLYFTVNAPVSYTHLTLPTIYSV